MTKRTIIILAAVGLIVAAWVIAAVVPHSRLTPASTRDLNASGWRGALSFTFMNREDVPARDCRFTIRDSSGDTWGARLDQDVASMQRVEIRWSAFTSSGQPMPIEYARRGIIAVCDVGGQELSVGFGS
jgi:hypothetical protein